MSVTELLLKSLDLESKAIHETAGFGSLYFVGNFEEISYRHGSCGRKLRLGLQRQRNFVLENEGVADILKNVK